MFDKWNCEVCGKLREDEFIEVVTYDFLKNHNLPEGTVKRNVKYCNDNEYCIQEAHNKERWEL